MNLHRKLIAAEQKYQHLLKGSVFLKIFLGGMKGFFLPNRIEGERVKKQNLFIQYGGILMKKQSLLLFLWQA